MVIAIHFDQEYIKKAGISFEWKGPDLIAHIPSSYEEGKRYTVDVAKAAERKRELFEKWKENSMEQDLSDMIYSEFPYDVANFIIYGIEVY